MYVLVSRSTFELHTIKRLLGYILQN
uniref:Uncharacterized protein n=1 Tax=Rhizophora mucronata TaxID=61149 RepID=A0A2P2P601_RHIMU